MTFFSSEVALYLYKPTVRPCIEYCSHVCTGAPYYYLDMLYKLQTGLRRTVGPTFATFLELVAPHQNVTSFSLFNRYFVDVHVNWLNRLHFLIILGRPLIILIGCMMFLSPSLDIIKRSISRR